MNQFLFKPFYEIKFCIVKTLWITACPPNIITFFQSQSKLKNDFTEKKCSILTFFQTSRFLMIEQFAQNLP